MARCRELGANMIEVENHAADISLDRMRDEVHRLKDGGFLVVGEVGAKWAGSDKTRITADSVDVNKTIDEMSTLLEAGADHVYWEGMVVRALIGNKLENKAGRIGDRAPYPEEPKRFLARGWGTSRL
jgi:phosphosulfolactate synthase (CoM biosynthesis protein A)